MSGSVQEIVEDIFRRKSQSRRQAAALPIEEKLRRLVAMQRRANEIRRSAGRPPIRVWDLNGPGKSAA